MSHFSDKDKKASDKTETEQKTSCNSLEKIWDHSIIRLGNIQTKKSKQTAKFINWLKIFKTICIIAKKIIRQQLKMCSTLTIKYVSMGGH